MPTPPPPPSRTGRVRMVVGVGALGTGAAIFLAVGVGHLVRGDDTYSTVATFLAAVVSALIAASFWREWRRGG